MRSFKSWVLLLVGISTVVGKISSISDSSVTGREIVTAPNLGDAATGGANWKRKDQSNDILSTSMANRYLRNINKEDYPHVDPSPGSQAAMKSGPIEHGTPLMPYVPRPIPPAPAPAIRRPVYP